MSFLRLIYLSSLIGGWAGFLGWLCSELLFGRYIDRNTVDPFVRNFLAVLMATLVAVPIGGGISAASELSNFQIPSLVKRLLIGFVGGLVGGLIGGALGAIIFALVEKVPFLAFIGRIVGWTLIGVGIGVGLGAVEGIFERSLKKLRNGVIGGILGGFLGGFFFTPVTWIIGSPMSSRAFGFVLLGLSIGGFIGLAQVILKEAWLTVEQGFRPGRQKILADEEITMGTSEKSSIIFIAFGAKGVEPIHLRVRKAADGRYILEDNQSRTGTLLNGIPVTAPALLNDGDTIQFGVNVVRFRERVRHANSNQQLPPASLPAPAPAPVPVASTAIQSSAPVPVKSPVSSVAIQTAPAPVMKSPTAVTAKPPTAAPAKPVASAPAKPAVTQPQEGRCPLCDKKKSSASLANADVATVSRRSEKRWAP